MKKSVFVVGFLMLVIFCQAQNVQVVSVPKYQASSIYYFTRLINWPTAASTGEFIIAVVGNEEVSKELSTLAAGKTVGAQTIKVKSFKRIEDIDGYNNIVFLAGTMGVPIKKLAQKVDGQKTLLITECEGLLNWGSAINFVERGGFWKFEVNKTNILTKGLQVSSQLEKMAINVI